MTVTINKNQQLFMKGDTTLFTSSCFVTMQKQTLVGCDDVENNWLLFVNINNNDICISCYKILLYFWNIGIKKLVKQYVIDMLRKNFSK